MGVNHYLGTFDSEWDAAAIYGEFRVVQISSLMVDRSNPLFFMFIAWAHLILYGEEATRQAQQEGEEAAAAYEQEKRDIASGKIPEPAAAPQPEKKKKKKEKKEKATPTTPKSREKGAAPDGVQSSGKATETKKRKTAGKTARAAPSAEKKPKSAVKTTRLETIAPVIAKGVTKVSIRICHFSTSCLIRS
jgi:outer membrane biosynthesis protein TonB